MSLTLTDIESLSSEIAPFYFKKQPNSKYLITNEFGYYSYLSESEFHDFISGKIVT